MAGDESFEVDHDKIAALALDTYLNTIPPRGAKPGTKSNGRVEWTILAAFVLSYSSTSSQSTQYALISLATGLRCLPYASLPPNGDVLHDQHAEVLARRGARQWLLQRLQHEVSADNAEGLRLFQRSEEDLVQNGSRRWKLRQSVRLHLYVSTLPCGDASNKLLEFQRAAQDQVAGKQGALTPSELLQLHTDASESSTPSGSSSAPSDVVRGRASSSHTQATPSASSSSGSLRTKPGRPDSPPSISMSCSDKLALWNAPGIGIQGSLLSSLLEPVHIHSITMCDHPTRHIFPAFPLTPSQDSTLERQREELKKILADDCRRALQRARPKDSDEIVVGWSTAPFADSKEAQLERAWSSFASNTSQTATSLPEKIEAFKAAAEPVSCPNSILYMRELEFESGKGKVKVENLATGTKMGAPTKRPKSKALDSGESLPLKPPARSSVCRLNYFQTFVSAYNSITGLKVPSEQERVLFSDAKGGLFGEGTNAYRRKKDVLLGGKELAQRTVEKFLKGARNGTAIRGAQHDGAPQLIQEAQEQDAEQEEGTRDMHGVPAFKGWLRTPAALSHFDLDGHSAHDLASE